MNSIECIRVIKDYMSTLPVGSDIRNAMEHSVMLLHLDARMAGDLPKSTSEAEIDARIKEMVEAYNAINPKCYPIDIDYVKSKARAGNLVLLRDMITYQLLLEGYDRNGVAKALGRMRCTTYHCYDRIADVLSSPESDRKAYAVIKSFYEKLGNY